MNDLKELWNLRNKDSYEKLLDLKNSWEKENEWEIGEENSDPRERFLDWKKWTTTEEVRNLFYDESSPKDIEEYAKLLIGKTFYDVLENNSFSDLKDYYDRPKSKGSLGNLLEEHYFYYEANSDSEADFSKAGVELKVTPYEITKTKKIRAGERLVIGMISNTEPITCNFYESHLLEKIETMLLIFYLRDRKISRTSYKIDYVTLFSILSKVCKEDLKIILDDYKIITNKIIAGRAHELSEGDTKYLGACTKGATADKSLQDQYYNKLIPAKRRAFCLKQGYMSYVINQYVLNNEITYDSAVTEEELEKNDFDSEILKRINKYKGYTEEEIYKNFEIDTKIKQKNNLAVCRMLGVKTDKVAEFEKANIKIKTIRVQKNGKLKESMSFPTMKIKEFVKEKFEESEVYDYFSETRFLFVVFKEQEDGHYKLIGSKFWNMPIKELESTGYKEWEEYRQRFIKGIKFTFKQQNNGKIIIKNDLPKMRDTKIFHLRPHAKKAAYIINGKKYGTGESSDMDELLNGDKMTKQCFWLNSSYVADIVKDI